MVLAVAYVAYVLWPRWPSGPVSLDAPALPVIDLRRDVHHRAGGDPHAGAKKARHPGADRPRLSVAVAHAARPRRQADASASRSIPTSGCSSPSLMARHAAARWSASNRFIPVISPNASRGPARTDVARVPRRHTLSRRGPDLRPAGARAFPGALRAARESASIPERACWSGASAMPTSRCAFRATGCRLARRGGWHRPADRRGCIRLK